jgi:sulfur carrier protein
MRIVLNGEERHVDGCPTVADLLHSAGYGDRRVAVEVNREVVPRSLHPTHPLADGDAVEIIQAIGGG